MIRMTYRLHTALCDCELFLYNDLFTVFGSPIRKNGIMYNVIPGHDIFNDPALCIIVANGPQSDTAVVLQQGKQLHKVELL